MWIDISLHHYIVVGTILFSIGVVGLLLRKNIIILLMCIEIMISGAHLILVALGRFYNDYGVQALSFFSIILFISGIVVGLIMVMSMYRQKISKGGLLNESEAIESTGSFNVFSQSHSLQSSISYMLFGIILFSFFLVI